MEFEIKIYFYFQMTFKTGFATFFLLAILRSSEGRSGIVGVIIPNAQTSWGDWGAWQYCPDGQWVNWLVFKFNLNSEI